MPRGDRTGPMGLGPRTGRAAGYCSGYSTPGFMNPMPGFGRGLGFGRGFRRGFAGVEPAYGFRPTYGYGTRQAPVQPTNEKQLLKEDLEALKQEKNAIEQELKEIEKRLKEMK